MSIVTVTDYGLAGFLVYCQYWLVEVESDREAGNSYTFEIPQDEFDAYQLAWESSEGQYVPNAKLFCQSLKRIDALQRQAFRNGGHWSDRKFVENKGSDQHDAAYWDKVRENVAARQRERDMREWRGKRDAREKSRKK